MKGINLLSIASLMFVVACSNDKEESLETKISGYYQIASVISSQEVDLNNDGIRTKDLYKEISDPHSTIDHKNVSFYDFESISSRMEVRPLKDQWSDAQFIMFNIPDQRIDQTSTGEFFLTEYIRSFNGCTYILNDKSNKIEIVNHWASLNENGSLNDFELQADGTLKLEIEKQLFDFIDLKWISADVTIVYEKVEL